MWKQQSARALSARGFRLPHSPVILSPAFLAGFSLFWPVHRRNSFLADLGDWRVPIWAGLAESELIARLGTCVSLGGETSLDRGSILLAAAKEQDSPS